MPVGHDEFFEGICMSCTGQTLPSDSHEGEYRLSQWDTSVFTDVNVKEEGSDYVFRFQTEHCQGNEGEDIGVKMTLHDSYGNLCVEIRAVGGRGCYLDYRNIGLHRIPLNRTIGHVRTIIETICQDLVMKIGL